MEGTLRSVYQETENIDELDISLIDIVERVSQVALRKGKEKEK